jgi:hypothetical protein
MFTPVAGAVKGKAEVPAAPRRGVALRSLVNS